MDLELISFKICPFVQRAVITLLYKDIPYRVTYIDLSSPPEWFTRLSPFGKVPILKVDDRHVIFESAIIDEFLDELYDGKLLPADPLQRAIDRSWIDFGSSLMLDFSGLIHATDADAFDSKMQTVKKEFDWLENKLDNGPYFNGDSFSLVDIAYAPLFMRTALLNLGDELYPSDRFPKIAAWADKLLSIPVLPKSVVGDFNEIFKTNIKNKAPYAAAQLGL
ncbi:MAG: glutathione S-transferase family protein [Gammaproteobacteria bacterium]|jgi:glutathione S-transferase